MTLDNSFELRAERNVTLRCVVVRWNQVQSGVCYVKYIVTLKNSSGNDLYSEAIYNKRLMRVCDTSTYNNASFAELTVSFKNASKNFTAPVIGT